MTSLPISRRRFVVPVLVCLAASAATLDFSLQPVASVDTDVWWHLAGGRQMVAEHRLVLTDSYSFTYGGHVWINRHWLFQLIIYAAYAAMGLGGLVLVRSVLFVGALALLGRVAWERGAHLGAVVLGVIWAAAIESRYWHVRPHYVSLLCAAVCLWLLERAVRDRPRLAWWVPLVIVVWSNAHGGVSLIGFAMVVLYALGDRLQGGRDVAWVPVGALAFAALWITPQPLDNLWYVVQLSFDVNPYRDLIAEFQPVDLLSVAHWPTLVFLVLAGVSALVQAARRRYVDLFLVVAFSLLIPRMDRHQYLLLPLLVPTFAKLSDLVPRRDMGRAWAAAVALGCIVLLAREGAVIARRAVPPSSLVRFETVPEGASRFLLARGIRGPLFCDLNWSGYLVWRLGGHNTVYIDSRNDLVYVDPWFVREYVSILGGDLRPLDVRRVDVVVNQPGLSPALDAALEAGWVRVFDDSSARVFVRRGSSAAGETEGRPAASSPGDGAPWFMDAYKRGAAVLDADPSAAVPLLEEAVAQDPGCPRCHSLLGVAYARQGRLDAGVREWRRALVLTPLLRTVHGNLGRAALMRGDRAEAVDEYAAEVAISGDPDAARMLVHAGGPSWLSPLRNAWRRFWAPFVY